MAEKRGARVRPSPRKTKSTVTARRAARLYRLLKLLGTGPQTRETLARRLHLDVRSFYRDLDALRRARIRIVLQRRRYALAERVEAAVARLPFPDPRLTLGEAILLSKGRTHAHRTLRRLIEQIVH
jgi:hypothetical protein